MDRKNSIPLLATIAAISSSILTGIGFLISYIIIAGLPLRELDTVWVIGTAIIVGFISIILGCLLGLIVGGIKTNIITTLIIGSIVGLIHSSGLMILSMEAINVSVRSSFLISLTIVGIISYIMVELVIFNLKKMFASNNID